MEDYAWEHVNPDAQEAEELRLPRVTWYNGRSQNKAAGGILYLGGMTTKKDSLRDGDTIAIPYWTEGSFDAGGKTIVTLENINPVVTIVRYRRRWARFDGNACVESFPISEPYIQGFKIQLEAAGFIKGFDSPVRFDLRGHASGGLLDALRDHAAKIVAVANKEAPKGKLLPPYAFWLRLKPGKHQKVGKGQQSDVTLPELVLPAEGVNSDYVKRLYVGTDLLLKSQDLFLALAGWTKEWGSGQAARVEQSHEEESPTRDEQPRAQAARAGHSIGEGGRVESPAMDDDDDLNGIPF